MGEDDDWGIVDPEASTQNEKQEFSHEQLIMRAMKKCLDEGSKEMVEGYFNEKRDREGNLIRTYVADTRKVFIQSVKILMRIMSCNLDDDAKKNIKKILEDLDKSYLNLSSQELKDMYDAPPLIKRQRMLAGITHIKDNLNRGLSYYQDYIYLEVESYLEVFGELNMLSERLGLGKEKYIHA